MVVAPATSRQRLQLEMAEVGQNVVASARNVAPVVEDGHVRVQRLRRLGCHAIVFLQREARGFLAILLLKWIEPIGFHELQAPASTGFPLANDVEKDAVTIGKEAHSFPDLLAEIVEIRAVKIHHVESGLQRGFCPTCVAAILVHFAPFGVLVGCEIVHAGGEINWRVDAGFFRGVVLLAKKIEVQMRVDFSNGRRVITPTMVAL